MSGIKEYFLGLRNRFSSKKDNFERYALNYNEAITIGVLFYDFTRSQKSVIVGFVDKLRLEGKQVKVLIYSEEDNIEEVGRPFPTFTQKDISVLGNIQSEEVIDFTDQTFDYLFCLYLKHVPTFDFILSKSKAKLRIGKYFENSEDYLDLMLNLSENSSFADLIEMILQYTKKLN